MFPQTLKGQRVLRLVPNVVTGAVGVLGTYTGVRFLVQVKSVFGEDSAITVGLAVGLMGTLAAVCLWVGRKTGAYDARLKAGEDKMMEIAERLEKTEGKLDSLPCHDPLGNVCPPTERHRK